MDHLITADETEEMQVHFTWLDWTMTLSQLFDHNDAEQLTQAVTKIRDTITGSFDASELLQNLDEQFQSKPWIFSSPLILFLVIALVLCSVSLYGRCAVQNPVQPLTFRCPPHLQWL
jgi:hypothetical protein